MTLEQSIAATLSNTVRYKQIDKFTKSFNSGDLGNLEKGEEFIVPENYVVIASTVLRDGKPVTNSRGEAVTAEFIRVKTTGGRFVNFYPTSLTKTAFAVNDQGKDIVGEGRVVRSKGALADYARKHLDINETMTKLVGCTIKLANVESVKTRRFGISNQDATPDSVESQNVGTWELVGDKKPDNWSE